ncbi:MAG TPA: DUF4386 domain-containing protein [Lysobacter sp.]|nr:DUF4386 domain-containing protein [Lysobacter sp.]
MASTAIESSPQKYARLGGIAYLIIIVAGVLGELYVRETLVVSGDATATARNIMDSPLLWRAGIAGDLLMHICDVLLMLVLYVLLRPVSRSLALLGLLFHAVSTAVLVINKLNMLVPLLMLGDADYLKAIDSAQAHALAYVAIRTHAHGFNFGLIFFGFACVVRGYLIHRSGYLPKVLGVLLVVAGACYVFNSFAVILAPSFSSNLFPWILLPSFVAELALALWLVVKGVDMAQWNARALGPASWS